MRALIGFPCGQHESWGVDTMIPCSVSVYGIQNITQKRNMHVHKYICVYIYIYMCVCAS